MRPITGMSWGLTTQTQSLELILQSVGVPLHSFALALKKRQNSILSLSSLTKLIASSVHLQSLSKSFTPLQWLDNPLFFLLVSSVCRRCLGTGIIIRSRGMSSITPLLLNTFACCLWRGTRRMEGRSVWGWSCLAALMVKMSDGCYTRICCLWSTSRDILQSWCLIIFDKMPIYLNMTYATLCFQSLNDLTLCH